MTVKTQSRLLEVIACSMEDAVEAERGGAGRLEVISRFEIGGLTPPFDMVRRIRQSVGLPLRVMLREFPNFEVSGKSELERLCETAKRLVEIGVDGLVIGFLRKGRIDVESTARILECVPEVRATFHHAFEDSADKLEAISVLKSLPQIDRILSHGGPGDVFERATCLNAYAAAAGPEIRILAGGGIDLGNLPVLSRETSVLEFHVGRAARENGKVSATLVRQLAAVLQGNNGSDRSASVTERHPQDI